MVNDVLVKQMLDKADAAPFVFCGDGLLVLWRVAEVDDEIFASCAYNYVNGCVLEMYYTCDIDNDEGRHFMYDQIIEDFIICYADFWRKHEGEFVFDVVAGPDCVGLKEILDIFHKKYSTFLNDLMYWYSIMLEDEFEALRAAEDDSDEDEVGYELAVDLAALRDDEEDDEEDGDDDSGIDDAGIAGIDDCGEY